MAATSTPVTANKAPKPDKSSKKDEKTASQPDGIQLALVALALFGMGAIIGYVIFYSIYNHRCSDMMDDTERRFNDTKQQLQNKLIEAMHSGSGNENRESELLELRGRLESQTGLMNKHQALLDKHQATVDQLAAATSKQDKNLVQNSRLETELESYKKTATKLENTLSTAQGEKQELAQKLQQATSEIEELTKQLDASGGDPNCEASQAASTAHLQALHKALSIERHGEGPYFVEFTVGIEGQEKSPTFVVEVSTLDTLPNSVFAFLTMVDNGIYSESDFFLTQSVIHLNSNEEKLPSIGYGASALSLVEDVTAGPCAPYSLGFVGSTGGLKILMTSDTSKHGSLACFGRIAQGRQTVSQIQQATREGKELSIDSVKFGPLRFAGKPGASKPEL